MMKRFYITTEKGRTFEVMARGTDDAAWTAAKQLEDGDAVIRVEPF